VPRCDQDRPRAEASCWGPAACAAGADPVACCAGAGLSADGLCGAGAGRGVSRNVCELPGVKGAPDSAGGSARLDRPVASELPAGGLGLDSASLRRCSARRSVKPRDRALPEETPGAEKGTGRSIRGLSTAGGAGLVILSAPIRLPISPVPAEPGRLASDGCGRARNAEGPGQVRPENRLEPKVLGLGALGAGLGAGAGAGLGAGVENDLLGADGLGEPLSRIWESPRRAELCVGAPALNEGLEGIVGAGLAGLMEGLGRLAPMDGLGALGRIDEVDPLEPLDEPERPVSALCMLGELASSRPPASGEISTEAITTTTAARDLANFFVNMALPPGRRIQGRIRNIGEGEPSTLPCSAAILQPSRPSRCPI